MKLMTIEEVQGLQLELMKQLHDFLQDKHIPYYLLAGSALGAVRHNGFIPWDDDIDIGLLRADYERFLALSDQFDGKYEIVNFKNAKNCDFGLTRIYFPDTYIDVPSISETRLDKRLYFDIFPLDRVPESEAERKKYEKKIQRKKSMLAKVDVRDYGTGKHLLLAKKIVSALLLPFRQRLLASFDRLMRKYENEDTGLVCSLCSQYSFEKQVMPKEVYGLPTLHAFEDASFYIPERIDQYLTTLYGSGYMQVPPCEQRREGHDIYSTKED